MKRAILVFIVLALVGVTVFRYNIVSVKRSLLYFILSGQEMAAMPQTMQKQLTTRGMVLFALNELLSDDDSRVREAALTLLLPYHHKFTTPQLIKLLNDPVSSIRRSAVIGLGDMRCLDGVLPIAKKLQSESDWNVSSEMAIALGRIGDGRASPYLSEKLKQADNNTLRISLASALFVLTSSDIYSDILKTTLLEGTSEERIRMASVFAMIDNEKLYEFASSFEGNSDEGVRNRAKEFVTRTEQIKKKFSLDFGGSPAAN